MTTEPTSPFDLDQIEQRLALQAGQFSSRPGTGKRPATQTFIVADFEYAYDRERHRGYLTAEDVEHETFKSQSEKDKRMKLRWPFQHVVAASWTILRFKPGAEAPDIDTPVVLTASNHSELEMTEAFFAALTCEPGATLVTWGGECKDLAALRRSAGDYGLVLPVQLRELNPYATSRIDLCNEVSCRADSVHLPEYAHACSIPAKPSPSKAIGKLVEKGLWDAVAEQVMADVLTTAAILLRHLAMHGKTTCKPEASLALLSEAALKASPASRFLLGTFAPWVRGRVAAASLKGVIYRAA